MTGMILGALALGFFTGGNVVLMLKDIEHKGKAYPLNVTAVCVLVAGSLTLIFTTLAVH